MNYTQLYTREQVNHAIANRMEVEYNPFDNATIDAAPRSGQWRPLLEYQYYLRKGTYRARHAETAQ